MAQLKDTVVAGNLRVTDATQTDSIQARIVNAPASSGASTYSPGTDGQVLKSNGTTAYWGTASSTDENVTQTATTTNSAYEVLLSGTADNTTRTEGARKTSTLTYNPSTKALVTGGTVNGYTLAGASAKAVDTTIANASSSANLPTSSAVASFVEGKGYTTNTGTVTGVKVNGTTKSPTSGVVDIGTVITDVSGKSDKTATVSTVTYDTTNKKITKTINGATTDVVAVSTLKTDMALAKGDVGLGNVENKSSATIRGELTSSNVTTALGYTPYNSTNPNGYTSNTGTVTGVKVNGTTKSPTSGVVDIGTVLTSLPTATDSVLGGIKVGSNLSISNGVLSANDSTKIYTATCTSAGDASVKSIVCNDIPIVSLYGNDVIQPGTRLCVHFQNRNTYREPRLSVEVNGTAYEYPVFTIPCGGVTYNDIDFVCGASSNQWNVIGARTSDNAIFSVFVYNISSLPLTVTCPQVTSYSVCIWNDIIDSGHGYLMKSDWEISTSDGYFTITGTKDSGTFSANFVFYDLYNVNTSEIT